MMTNDERRKVFWLLKKYSSYTAWKALGDAYAAFADAWMEAMRRAKASDIDAFNENATKSILDGRIAFEKGLPKLKQGDRRVWRRSKTRSLASWGTLSQGIYEIGFIRKIMDPQEYVFDWMKNKDNVIRACDALLFSCARLGSATERLEPSHPAPLSAYDALQTVHPEHGYRMNDPRYLNFPRQLPVVPAPSEITTNTGDAVPADGIYEPEWGDISPAPSAGLFGKIKTAISGNSVPDAKPDEPRRLANIGCMNYLLAGTSAPPYQDGELEQPRAVTWRLIWKDDRYLDGTIPPEEDQYLAEPAEPGTPRLRCEATNPCPREGWWHTPAQVNSRRHFKAGEVMPDLHTDYGATIWEWDGE